MLSRIGNRYLLKEISASGGMGDVFRAVDLETQAAVAVKVLQLPGPEAAQRFEREAQVLSQLSHPHIVRYISHGTEGEAQYLVMEWVTGETLSKRLETSGLTVQESVDLIAVVSQAVGAIHSVGLVHRDLKPANLIFPQEAPTEVKLIDFGVARRKDDRSGPTRTGVAVGSSGYMSPEQARGQREIDARSDVFALGCVLYECLVGSGPFRGSDFTAVCAKVLVIDPPPVRALNSEVSPELDRLVRRLLAKNQGERPKDGNEVASLLAALPRNPSLLKKRRGESSTEAPTASAVVSATVSTRAEWYGSDSYESRARFIIMVGEHDDGAPVDPPIGAELAALRDLVASYDGYLESLQRGGLLIIISGHDPHEVALRASRCAMALREKIPLRPMVLSFGSIQEDPGSAIEKGVASIAEEDLEFIFHTGEAPGTTPPRIRVEASAVPYLTGRCQMVIANTVNYLVGL